MNATDSVLIGGTIEDFKKLAASFLKNLPLVKTVEQVDAGIKCLGIAYFDMTQTDASDLPIAISVLDYAARKAGDRIVEIEFGKA